MANLDQPGGYFADPGPDQRPQALSEHVDAILATVGADRIISPDEIREIQRLMGGLQAIGAQHQAQAAAAQAQQGISDETEPFGAAAGTEPVNEEPEGASYMQG